MALFPQQYRNYLNERFFLEAPNRLRDLVPNAGPWQEMVRVIDAKDVLDGERGVLLLADASEQQARIFIADPSILSSTGPFPIERQATVDGHWD